MISSSCINSNFFIIIAVLITLVIGDELSEEDNNVLGNLFITLGSLALTKSAQKVSKQKQDDLRQQINDIECQLQALRSQLR